MKYPTLLNLAMAKDFVLAIEDATGRTNPSAPPLTRTLVDKVIEPRRWDGENMTASEWFDVVESAAAANGWPIDENLVLKAATYLDGNAFTLYQLLKEREKSPAQVQGANNRLSGGIYYENVSWQKFTDFMKQVFPECAAGSGYSILTNRIQRAGEPFARYAAEKLRLCKQCDPKMTEQAKIEWVKTGLTLKLAKKLAERKFKTVGELFESGLKAEQIQNMTEAPSRLLENAICAIMENTSLEQRPPQSSTTRGRIIGSFPPRPRQAPAGGTPTNRPQFIGSNQRGWSSAQRPRGNAVFNGDCRYCGIRGHKMAQCRKRLQENGQGLNRRRF